MGGLVKKVISPITSIFGAPAVPVIPETEVMPIADEEALAAARKRTAAKKGSGRASTVLSLGSGAGKKTLGS